MSATITYLLTPEDERAILSAHAREQLRADLSAYLARQRAARILHEHESERRAIRRAQRDAAAQRRTGSAMDRAMARPNLDLLAAKRRDEYKRALSYPMTPAEVLAAAREACEHLPDDEERADTVSALVRSVIARHGRTPLRCDIGAHWLRQLAERTYARETRKREHKTGMGAAAAQLRTWAADDSEDERVARESDPVLWRAMGLPAPTGPDALSAAEVAARLQLSAKQTGALRYALDSAKRATLPLSAAERKAAADARAILRKRYPDSYTLTLALHPERVPAEALTATMRVARERAAMAARGSHLPGQWTTASTRLLARFRPAAPLPADPPRIVGPMTWPRYGTGWAGACSIRPVPSQT